MNEYSPEINGLNSPTLGKASPFPARDNNAMTGSQFGKSVIGLLGQARDDRVIEQVLAGNVPFSVRNFRPVTLVSGGNTLQYWVSGDVLSVGSDLDYLRVSLNGKSAKSLLDRFDCMLPTKKMSDDIWRSADLKLSPRPMGASSSMTNTQTLINHNTEINKQIAGRPFTLLTGTKKDTVIDKMLLAHKNNIGIYGWFNPNSGVAIQGPQPNCTSHSIDYQDYSSSVRIVSQNGSLNGNLVNLFDILSDDDLCYLLSEQGSFNGRSIYA